MQNVFPRVKYVTMNSVTYKIIHRLDCLNKKGEAPLSLQVFVNGEKVVIPLHIKVPQRCFMNIGERVAVVNHPHAKNYNNIITDALQRASDIQSNANMSNFHLDRETFKKKMDGSILNISFSAYMLESLTERKPLIENGTWEFHLYVQRKMCLFKPVVLFSDLTFNFFESFKAYCMKENISLCTWDNILKTVQTYIHRAEKAGLEFKYFKYPRVRITCTSRVNLSQDETQTLINKYQENTLPLFEQKCLRWFLFATFTGGLRSGDAKRFAKEHTKWYTEEGLKLIPRKTRKLNKEITIPVTEIAQYFIDEILSRQEAAPRHQDNMNKTIGRICAGVKIKKHVTFHIARHTFANMFLECGGAVEVLQKILGHAKIETTMIYVHTDNVRKAAQMKQMDNFFKAAKPTPKLRRA